MKKSVFLTLLFAFTFAFTSTRLAAETPAPAEVFQSYKVGIGDLLRVEVYDEEDLTREVRVLTDGTLSLPLIGTIHAAGLTISELESTVTRLLAEKYLVNPQVTVFVKEFSNIYIFGEVRKPGSF